MSQFNLLNMVENFFPLPPSFSIGISLFELQRNLAQTELV